LLLFNKGWNLSDIPKNQKIKKDQQKSKVIKIFLIPEILSNWKAFYVTIWYQSMGNLFENLQLIIIS
jgi:hypothetical protein